MTIGIILHPYGEEKPGGLARTILEWTKGLLRNDFVNEYVIFLKKQPRVMPELPGKNWKIEILGGGLFWLNKLKSFVPADVYIFQTPVLPIFFKPKRSIVIAQDFPYKYLKPRSVKERLRNCIIGLYHQFSFCRANAIVAVSKAAKSDIMRFFRIPERKIRVIYMGFKRVCQVPEIAVNLPKKFFFFAGVIKERKNVLNIVKAFQEFSKRNPQHIHKLVFGGKAEGGYFEAVKDYISRNRLKDSVIFIGYFNDGQLSYIYKRAEALIFPSIVESFGFPVLEAMDCGLPVITSNIFGPAELGAGGSAILIDPYKPEEIAKAMEKIASDREFRDKLSQNGIQRSRQFSWDKAAKEMLEFIKEIA